MRFEERVGFLRGGARPPISVLIDYIRLHKQEFGVEPIGRVLSEHGITIAPSTYYDNVFRTPSPSSWRAIPGPHSVGTPVTPASPTR